MKKTKKILLATCIIVFSIILIMVNTKSYATNENITNTLEEAKCDTCKTEKTINPNATVFVCEDNITIDQKINGDAFLCGKYITINSEIGGNVFICCDTVKMEEGTNITGSAFICSKYTSIQGGKCGTVYNCSKDFQLGKDSRITRDLFLAVEQATIEGRVERDAFIGCKYLEINEKTAKIENNLTYSAQLETENVKNIVGGEVKFDDSSIRNEQAKEVKSIFSPAKTILSIAISIVTAIIIGLIMLLLADKFTDKSVKVVSNKPIITLLYGFLGSIVVFVVSILAMLTFIGIRVGLLLMAISIFGLFISSAVTTVTLSKLISERMKKGNGMTILFVAIITLAYGILALIPGFGGILKYVYTIYGFGIILYNIIHKTVPEKIENKKEEIK